MAAAQIFPTRDHDAAAANYHAKNLATNPQFSVVFMSFPSAKDASWSKRFPGKSTGVIIAEARHDWFAPWLGTKVRSHCYRGIN